MTWADLQLWVSQEERRIYDCVLESLRRLIQSKTVKSSDQEDVVSGKLRKIMYKVKKEMRLSWQMQPQATCFIDEESSKVCGHPDFRFSGSTPEYDQYEYDIECKLVRVRRKGKSHDYCNYYVVGGMQRYRDRIYAQSRPPMGMIIGYVQEGDILELYDNIDDITNKQGYHRIISRQLIQPGDVSRLSQNMQQASDLFLLHHLWVDLRVSGSVDQLSISLEENV